MNGKKVCIYLLKCIGILLAGAIIGTLLLAAAFLLPVNQNNYMNSKEVLEREGYYPLVPYLSDAAEFGSYFPGGLDNWTDGIMITTAIGTSDGNIFVRAMNAYSELIGNYSYYWHGYITFLRPLLLVFDYGELRSINAILQIFCISMLAICVMKKLGRKYLILLFSEYALLMPMTLFFSFQYSWVFYIQCLFTLFIISKQEYLKINNRIYFAFIICGMLTSYMDLLTYPLITWGVPIVWWLLESKNTSDDASCVIKNILTVIESAAAWIFGYAGMWMSKWIIGGVILHRNLWDEAVSEIFIRTGAQEGATINTLVEAVSVNWKHYSYSIYLIILAGWLLFFIYMSVQHKICFDSRIPALILTFISSIVWYCALNNHTKIHHFFTYRIWNVGIFAVMACVILCVSKEKNNLLKVKLPIVCIWIIIMALAVLLSGHTTGTVISVSGGGEMIYVSLDEGFPAEMTFTPKEGQLVSMTLNIQTDSDSGYFDIKIKDKSGKVIERKKIAMSAFSDESYTFETNCHMNVGEEYIFSVEAVRGNGESRLILCNTEGTLADEFDNIVIQDTITYEGQPITMLEYNVSQPASGKEHFFGWLSAVEAEAVALIAIIQFFYCIILKKQIEYKC